jgi:hypothetical protein
MADLSITAGNVKVTNQNTTLVGRGQAGATVTHAQPLYKHTDNKYYPADNDDTAAKAVAVAISLTPALADEWFYFVTSGPLSFGAILTVGTEYYVSSNVGGICPRADLGSNDYITRLGIATTTSLMDVKIHASGVQVP